VKKRILIVDDQATARAILTQLFSKEYIIFTANNGKEALDFLHSANQAYISAVILDIIMPVMDGFEFLREIKKDHKFDELPIIISTSFNEQKKERKALALGAWDFVNTPYDPEVLRFRVKNVILRSRLTALKKMEYISTHDELTGIFNKKNFIAETKINLENYPTETFMMLLVDIKRFALVNSFYGTNEGNKLLRTIAIVIRRFCRNFPTAVYGRMESDIFAILLPYDNAKSLNKVKKLISDNTYTYKDSFKVLLNIGIYLIINPDMPIEVMISRATMAAKTIKQNSSSDFAFYTEAMGEKVVKEQLIVNKMDSALANDEFKVWLQPKYNTETQEISGAEALVRWIDKKGAITSPGDFIPIFEQNGFISKLDYNVWEKTCKQLRIWIDKELPIYPISINVSRVDLYNVNLDKELLFLIKKYDIPISLLHLEITESVFVDQQTVFLNQIKKLKELGFVILMDDFGSGYSSLNTLKDMDIDILKIDMRFFSETENKTKSNIIVTSVVDMAKKIGIEVIAEGVELESQVDYLKSINCDYIQGYYFAKPMPIEDYEILLTKPVVHKEIKQHALTMKDVHLLWNNDQTASCMIDFFEDKIKIIATNSSYNKNFRIQTLNSEDNLFINCLPEYIPVLQDAFNQCKKNNQMTNCIYERRNEKNKTSFINITIKFFTQYAQHRIYYCSLSDITNTNTSELLYQRNSNQQLNVFSENAHVLIISNSQERRLKLINVLNHMYKVHAVSNKNEAIEYLTTVNNQVHLIITDTLSEGTKSYGFFDYKSAHSELNAISQIVIVSSVEQEKQLLSIVKSGIDDFIFAPIVPSIALGRISHLLGAKKKMDTLIKEYNKALLKSLKDSLTGLYNREALINTVQQDLIFKSENTSALIMIDVDDFKQYNMQNGHKHGDDILLTLSQTMTTFFREKDILARIGGDEFMVYMKDVTSKDAVFDRCEEFCQTVLQRKGEIQWSVSLGLVFSDDFEKSFNSLYSKADAAMYYAKKVGKKHAVLYQGENSFKLAKDQHK